MIELQGEKKTYLEVRERMHDNIIDELMFISRASEGAVTPEWMMQQPISTRKKYVEAFTKELKEREARLQKGKKQP